MLALKEPSESEAERARDAARLKELETRLGGIGGEKGPSRVGEHINQANMAWRMVTELVAGLLLGLGIGYGLDLLFGTSPIMLVVFILLGFVAGVKVLMRTAAEMGKKPGHPGKDEGE